MRNQFVEEAGGDWNECRHMCPGEPGESGGPLIEKDVDEFAHGVEACAEFYDAGKKGGAVM